MEEKEMITISVKKYNQLIHDQKWLICLDHAGVDNWEGHDHAVDLWDEYYPGEEL